MAELIDAQDVLNKGREKINDYAIKPALRAEQNSLVAKNEAAVAKDTADAVDKRVDSIEASAGNDNTEIVAARTDVFGETHETLNKRNQVPEKFFKGRFTQVSRVGDFFNRLRNTTDALSIADIGDSLTYGYDITSADRRPPDTGTTDDGTTHVRERASITYPEALSEYMNMIYPGRITVRNMGYSGDNTTTSLQHWNASGCDLAIIMLGTNDRNDADFDRFLNDYRKIIMREQEAGTSVLLLTPPKRKSVPGRDLAPYRNAVIQLSKELNVPYVDMMDECANLNQSYYSDATHFNGKGYRFLGAKVTAILTGESVMNPRKVANRFLGLRDQIDGATFGASGTASWMTGTSSPTPSEVTENVGVGASLTANQDDTKGILYSFYTSEDNMVVYPSAYISPAATAINLELILDFETGGIGMANSIAESIVQTQYEPLQKISYNEGDQTYSTDLTAYNPNYLSIYHANYWTDKKLIIPKKGWHTVWVRNRSASSAINFFGLSAMPLDTFNAIKMANTPAKITRFVAPADTEVRLKVSDLNAVLRTAIKASAYLYTPALKVTIKTDGRAINTYFVQLRGFTSNGNRIADPADIRLLSSSTDYRTLTDVTFSGTGSATEIVLAVGGVATSQAVMTVELA